MIGSVDAFEQRARRARWAWALLGLLFVAAFAAAVGAVARDVYSPAGTVSGYLQALANHDLRAVHEMVGEPDQFPADQRTILLSAAALGRIDDIQIVQSLEIEPDLVQVTASYRLAPAGAAEPGDTYQRSFLLERGERAWVFFDRWQFVEPPVETVNVQVQHDRRFVANGQRVQGLGVAANAVTPYLVYSPGLYRIDYDDEYLQGEAVDLVASGDGGTAVLQLTPTEAFAAVVQSEVNAYLDRCAEQRVLQPAGCPFGHFVSDRIVSEPQWSLEQYPQIRVESGRDGFVVPPTQLTARLRVQVQALFDGSISLLDTVERVNTAFRLAIGPDGSITIQFAE